MTSSNLFGRLFYDAELGHTFIAPLIMTMDNRYDGSEIISKIDWIECEESTKVNLRTIENRSFDLRFEDDELFIDFE